MDFGTGEPGEEGAGGGLFFGGFEDDATLADRGIALGREADEGADVAEVRGAGDGKRDEAELGVAGFGELSGLAYVFGDDEFGGDFVGVAEAGEGFVGGEAVGGVETVGDGDPGDFGVEEGVEGDGLGGGVFASPQDEDAVGVGGGFGVGEAEGLVGGDELLGVYVVGREEEILGVAVEELLGERGGRAEGGDDLDAGLRLVGGGEVGKNGLKVGRGGDVELSGCLRARGVREERGDGEENQRKHCEEALGVRFTVP